MCKLVHMLFKYMCFFFKQKTAYEMRISDWSSDVCSSDLINWVLTGSCVSEFLKTGYIRCATSNCPASNISIRSLAAASASSKPGVRTVDVSNRSEERRVG